MTNNQDQSENPHLETPEEQKAKRGLLRQISGVFFFFLLAALIPISYTGWNQFYTKFLESDPPVIQVTKVPSGFGTDPVTFELKVSDAGSGLDEVIVRSDQERAVRDLCKKTYPGERKNEDTIQLKLQGKEIGLLEGKVRIIITAFDRSFWSTRQVTSLELNVDYRAPKLEALTTQHNALLGGVELVFYRVSDRHFGHKQGNFRENPGNRNNNNGNSNLGAETEEMGLFSGVRVGDALFPGFPAKNLDGDFQPYPNIYFAFFAVPLGFREGKDDIRLFARDQVGNTTSAPIFYRIREIPTRRKIISLDRIFLEERVEQLYQQYTKARSHQKSDSAHTTNPEISPPEILAHFRKVNEDYRNRIEESLKELSSRPIPKKLWEDGFSRIPGLVRNSFGEPVQYVFQGTEAGNVINAGYTFGVSMNTPIRAANNGIVAFGGNLGIYGKTVILDHGFGLSTLYGHLSSIECSEGDRLNKNDILGNPGRTGLTDHDCLQFEVRLYGVPVNPREWWDKKWINDHILQKTIDVKRSLGIQVLAPIE